jgi:hypothetical protein
LVLPTGFIDNSKNIFCDVEGSAVPCRAAL